MIRVPWKQILFLRPTIFLLLAVSIPILPATCLSGCAQKLPIDEGRMVIALPGAPVNVDPRVATDAFGERIFQMKHAFVVRSTGSG